jgi:hypothetical protein
MLTRLTTLGSIALAVCIFSCTWEKKTDNAMLFAKENLVAWCIVPFDSVDVHPSSAR